ncbi:hypothetical protein [Paenibacillus sp. MMO-177]|uniref:hypothetical protein n=1 Tax=Paenibacillus sp. MMO-177 TaxID=3081289 RepID=UPI00301AC215
MECGDQHSRLSISYNVSLEEALFLNNFLATLDADETYTAEQILVLYSMMDAQNGGITNAQLDQIGISHYSGRNLGIFP